MNKQKNIQTYLKGLSSGYVFIVASVLISFFMVPFSLRYLTKEEFGIFTIANELLLWFGLLELGTASVFNSKASHTLGREDTSELNIMVSSAIFIQLVAAVLIVMIGMFVSFHMETFFDLNENVHNIDTVFQILILGLALSISTNVFSSLLIASKQIHIDNYLRIGLLVIKTSLTVVLLMFGFKLLALALANLIGILIMSTLAFYRVKKSFPYVKIHIKYLRLAQLKEFVGKGWWFTVGGLAGILISSLDSFIIGKYISLATVTGFVITKKLFDTANRFFLQIFNVSRPYFGQFYGAGKYKEIFDLYQLSMSASIFISVAISVIVLLVNKWFIGIWIGEDYYLGDTLTLILAFNFVFQSAVIPNRILFATSLYNVRKQNSIRIYEGVVNLVLSLILVFVMQVEGVVLASVIATILFSNIYLNKMANNFFTDHNVSTASYKSYFAVLILPVLYVFHIELIVYYFLAVLSVFILGGILYLNVLKNFRRMKS